jgi:hypothetical protein
MRDPRYAQLRLRIPATHTFITAEPPANDAAIEAGDPTACQGLPGLFNKMVIQCLAVFIICHTAMYIAPAILAFVLDGQGKS